ncbi:MAG: transcription elongation factor GreA [Eubacteriales bacterium]|nr:transcription elongation factor GreA [Eubacteriales bacterium]MCI6633287.1 transcription elongation factor GreA [Clostridiales bacterium]MCI6961531.1 transcription elongation factor GreA [Clostridiales bacterium]MDD5908831.1 transcription elongation factor GreA [Clostridiales bacterium]MDD6838659.1 transcription elongation factor GreA [Clostridiales bacterium]
MAEVRLTKEGVEKYEKRLEYLKTTGRTEIAEQIKIARSFGDLSENAEYDAAKIEQARMEYEIVEIEAMLRNVVIIDEDNINTDVVNVGNTITVKNKTLNQEMTFQIVGSAEANPMEKRISNESPVGKGLLGHKLHETVSIQTPGGTAEFEILNISK